MEDAIWAFDRRANVTSLALDSESPVGHEPKASVISFNTGQTALKELSHVAVSAWLNLSSAKGASTVMLKPDGRIRKFLGIRR